MVKTIQKIHKKFDTAGEKMLAEARALVAASPVNDTKKIERFQKLGFTSGKPIKDAEGMFQKQQAAKETIEAVEYFQTYYPSYKFVPEVAIQKICKKYGLLYGDADKYIGDIPEKNLREIEAFKLREEDFYENSVWGMRDMVNEHLAGTMARLLSGPGRINTRLWEYYDYLPQWAKGVDPFDNTGTKSNTEVTRKPEPPKKQKPLFKICAPKKDFNVSPGDQIKDGWRLINDPIVIQPVKYKRMVGGLVVSKWGIEGQDENLVNEKNN